LKYVAQLGNWMIRRARCTKQPWEKVTKEGFILAMIQGILKRLRFEKDYL